MVCYKISLSNLKKTNCNLNCTRNVVLDTRKRSLLFAPPNEEPNKDQDEDYGKPV